MSINSRVPNVVLMEIFLRMNNILLISELIIRKSNCIKKLIKSFVTKSKQNVSSTKTMTKKPAKSLRPDHEDSQSIFAEGL